MRRAQAKIRDIFRTDPARVVFVPTTFSPRRFSDVEFGATLMVYIRCWDGVNLDSPDHKSHVAFPASGSFESGGPCPASHPVKIPQILYEVAWDTTPFNDPNDWPEDGSQPFVFSMGDGTGYGTHGVSASDRADLRIRS